MAELLGKRISALRSAKGLNQKQLAEKLNISPSAIGMYEQGRREPSLGLIVELARILSVSTDFLLTGRPAAPAAEDNVALQQLICSCVLPFGGKICFQPCCCKPHSPSTTKL